MADLRRSEGAREAMEEFDHRKQARSTGRHEVSKKEDPSLQCLPATLKRYVTLFLPLPDTLTLSHTCCALRNDLSLTCLELPQLCPRHLRWCVSQSGFDDVLRGNIPQRGLELVTGVCPHRAVHSVTFRCKYFGKPDCGEYRNPGWLYVVGHRTSTNPGLDSIVSNERTHFLPYRERGRVLAVSHAQDSIANFNLSFCPREDESYSLWYGVGGGGASGYKICVDDAQQVMVVYDNPSRGFRKVFRYLSPLFGRIDGGEIPSSEVEAALPRIAAVLEFLVTTKDACNGNADDTAGNVSGAMSKALAAHAPILEHLRAHNLDLSNDDIVHTLREMIPRVQLVASKIRSNFKKSESDIYRSCHYDDTPTLEADMVRYGLPIPSDGTNRPRERIMRRFCRQLLDTWRNH